MSLMMNRKSVRKFTEQKISKEDILTILKSAMQAPSAGNQQPWDFIVIEDKDTLAKLSEVHSGAWLLKDAPLCIHILMRENLAKGAMAPQDLGACAQNILLEAVNLGLGGCWVGVYPLEDRVLKVKEILRIKNGIPFANIAIGYPLKDADVQVRFDESRIHYEMME